MITTLSFEAAEKLINGYLRLDPDLLERLAELKGATLAVSILDWNLNFSIEIQSNGISLLNSYLHEPNARISGNLSPLLKLLKSKSSVHSPEVRIEGDMELVQSLNQIMRSIDIDWEEHLSKLLGDSITHQLSKHGRKLKLWLNKTIHSVKASCSEYIQEEACLSPSQTEVEDFYQDITLLRDDTERLEIKINQLLNPQLKRPVNRDH